LAGNLKLCWPSLDYSTTICVRADRISVFVSICMCVCVCVFVFVRMGIDRAVRVDSVHKGGAWIESQEAFLACLTLNFLAVLVCALFCRWVGLRGWVLSIVCLIRIMSSPARLIPLAETSPHTNASRSHSEVMARQVEIYRDT